MNQAREMPPPAYADGIQDSASFASMDTKRYARHGRKKPSAHEQAVLLSNATNQATAAAKSILISGGTQETALSTARAAAESVLLPLNSELSSLFSSKRQAKQQAHVVASMALLAAQAATNKFPNSTRSISSLGSQRRSPVIQQQHSRKEDPESLALVAYSPAGDDEAKVIRKNNSKPPRVPSSTSLSTSQPPSRKASPTTALSPSKNQLRTEDQLVELSSSHSIEARTKEILADTPLLANKKPEEKFEPRLLVQEPSQSYDSDDHSRSVSTADDVSVDNSVSSDAFENLKKSEIKKEEKVKEKPSLTFGNIFCNGMICAPSEDKQDDRDDCSGDNRSNYSRHSDDSSNDGTDREEHLRSPVRSPVRSRAYSWRSSSPREAIPTSPKEKTISRKNSRSSSKTETLKIPKVGPDVELPTKKPETKKRSKSKGKDSSRKSDLKTKLKDSMEKVVLRAMAAETAPTIQTNPSSYSKAEDSANAGSTNSSQNTGVSRGSRLSSWIRRRNRK